jgi:hypothetical protein
MEIILNATDLPARVTRRAAADLLTKNYFPISHRTLEAAALPWRRINGKALVDTGALIAWAEERLAAAAVVKGGRQK